VVVVLWLEMIPPNLLERLEEFYIEEFDFLVFSVLYLKDWVVGDLIVK